MIGPARLLQLIAHALMFASCGAPPEVPQEPATETPKSPGTARVTGVPDTPAGRQLTWLLDALNMRHGVLTRGELEAHFHDDYLTRAASSRTTNTKYQSATIQRSFYQHARSKAPLTVRETI